jgi:hypothetical protein
MFSLGSVQSGYEEEFSWAPENRVKFETPAYREMSLVAEELSRVEKHGKESISRCKEDFKYNFKWQWDC